MKDDSAVVRVNKLVQGILNKMTKEKFNRLATQIRNIDIESFDVLDLIIKKVYEKAIDEPAFGDMYASLCVQMSEKMSDAQR